MPENIEPIAERHAAVIERLTDAVRGHPGVVAAWLQGSRADDSADPFSDIDYYLAVSDEAYDTFDKLDFVEQIAPVLVHVDLFGMNAMACLLEGPVKLDLFVERASSAPSVARPAVRLLVDKIGIALRNGWEASDSDIARQIDSTIRGMLQGASWPVRLLRREQWMTYAYSELSLIHGAIVPLMLIQHDRRAFHRNAMTRERLLSSAERAEVAGLTSELLGALFTRSHSACLAAHLRILDALGRVARQAGTMYGIEYPEAAEQEARRFYEREWPGDA
jgi:hypothetical protein